MDTIRRVLSGEELDAAAAEAAFDRFMSGEATQAEMAALLTALRMRGETPAEVAGGVRALRKAMIPLALDDDRIIDTCGTGGGTLTTFNISTAASIVAVGGGVRIAKHGNRSFTSKCGSADVLEVLGVPIQLSAADEKRMFEATGFVFMFAPAHHPAMRHVGPVRAALGVTTIMNLLGPLANPAGVRRQVVGVAHPDLQRLVADALLELGHERALVVHGEPGMDELSPLGSTRVFQVEAGALTEFDVAPSDFGWPNYDPGDLAGGEPAENAERVRRVVGGMEDGAGRAAVVLNAAAAFWAAGLVDRLADGVAAAERSIDSGAASARLESLQAFRPTP
ncbi:anthranilate phosphoribosyltransferase [Candidatus Palauibacter sp.]|uniref:anthranilate phosphoribosyltransferase n=1 Tax=Candidatus Palauibacter sp. TaxID=3101350 RepID=UPI003B02E91A